MDDPRVDVEVKKLMADVARSLEVEPLREMRLAAVDNAVAALMAMEERPGGMSEMRWREAVAGCLVTLLLSVPAVEKAIYFGHREMSPVEMLAFICHFVGAVFEVDSMGLIAEFAQGKF